MPGSDASRPNIVFMHSHNTGRWVEPYGHAAPTPNLMRFAREGVLFRRAFCAAPSCSPSRASFLSGMYPHSCGMLGLAHRGFAMHDYRQHIVHTLKAAGYQTVLSGVEHTAQDISVVGYDRILADQLSDPAGAALAYLERPGPEPFFLSLGLQETHRPFPEADPDNHPAEDARYCRPPHPIPDTPATRADTADFKASARVMDTAYGAVLDALEARGIAGNTLVCCFSDHGLQFPQHMSNLTEGGIEVYLIVRGPGGFSGGKVVDGLVSLIDLVPTVYDVVGVDIPGNVQGRSLLPLVRGEVDALREEVFAEMTFHAAYEPARCVRGDRYKYVRRYDRRDSVVLPNADDSPSKQALLDKGWREQLREQEMLYDLDFDPGEACNLVASPRHAAILEGLQARLQAWMEETGDPLAHADHVPPPSGSQLNDPDGLSPNEPALRMP